jgi:hypothetical protein
MIEEVIYISDFNVKLDGTIEVRKTTDVTKDGAVIASSYWRTVLQVNDPAADEVLGVDGYYRHFGFRCLGDGSTCTRRGSSCS